MFFAVHRSASHKTPSQGDFPNALPKDHRLPQPEVPLANLGIVRLQLPTGGSRPGKIGLVPAGLRSSRQVFPPCTLLAGHMVLHVSHGGSPPSELPAHKTKRIAAHGTSHETPEHCSAGSPKPSQPERALPDGTPICHNFNYGNRVCRFGPKWHVCWHCQGSHPMSKCRRPSTQQGDYR